MVLRGPMDTLPGHENEKHLWDIYGDNSVHF